MTARPVHRRDRAHLARDYPMAGGMEGWVVRRRETSSGAYPVEGTDPWGRTVSRQGGDPGELLSQCVADAKRTSAGGRRHRLTARARTVRADN